MVAYLKIAGKPMEKLQQFRKLIREILLETLDDTQILSQYAHRGQVRRSGEPYFFHPQEVANIVKQFYPSNEVAYHAALLHDAIEDGIPLGNISDEEEFYAFISDTNLNGGNVEEVFNTVRALTKSPETEYAVYIENLLNEPTALKVKIADMMQNLTDGPSVKQVKKYSNAFHELSRLAGGKPPGISTRHWKAFEDVVKNA